MPTIWYPASTCKTSPVTPLPSSLNKNTPAPPTSFKSMLRLSGELYSFHLKINLKSPIPLAAKVLTGPAEIALTRILS